MSGADDGLTAEFIAQSMAALGMPRGAHWIEVRTQAPISDGSETVELIVEQGIDTTVRFPASTLRVPTKQLAQWDGFCFEVFGRAGSQPPWAHRGAADGPTGRHPAP